MHHITIARARAAYEASCKFHGLPAGPWTAPTRDYWIAVVAAVDAQTNAVAFASATERRRVLGYPAWRKGAGR